jgi:hypothetical protein
MGPIGVTLPSGAEDRAGTPNKVDTLVSLSEGAAASGLGSVRLSQQFDHDALSQDRYSRKESP